MTILTELLKVELFLDKVWDKVYAKIEEPKFLKYQNQYEDVDKWAKISDIHETFRTSIRRTYRRYDSLIRLLTLNAPIVLVIGGLDLIIETLTKIKDMLETD